MVSRKPRMAHPVTKWAAMLQFSTNAYYDWLKTKNERDRKLEDYEKAINKIFTDSGGTYGPDCICGVLRRQGYTASYRKVSRIMKELGLSSIHNRRRQRSLTDSRHARGGKEWPNLIRGLEMFRTFHVVTSDISYVRTSDNMKAELVTQTIKSAKKRWNLPEDCIHHSDLGAQYTAKETQALLKQLGFKQSFSRAGKPGDNAWSESFFSMLKKKTVHWHRFQTRADARQAIFAYIEGFYNTRRVQKRLGHLTPMEWLNQYTEQVLISVA